MYMEDIKWQIISTPLLRVLDRMLQHSGEEVSDSDIIEEVVGVKRAAVHQALTRLAAMGITRRVIRGRRCYNELVLDEPWLIHFKIASNILELAPLVENLKGFASKITLFGSRASGANGSDSDIDLAVIAADPDAFLRTANRSNFADRLQMIVKTPEEMLDLDAKEPVLAKEIRKGIVLWEK